MWTVSSSANVGGRRHDRSVTPADLLAFEARWPRHTPEKGAAIRRLGIHEVRYYQLLLRAASSPAGIAADPITARRVRERGARTAAARGRRMGSAA